MKTWKRRLLPPVLALPALLLFAGPECPAETFGKAPNFRAVDLDGEKVVLEDFLGRGPVLVQFWATWCKPCLKEMPYIQRMHEAYAERGLTVLSVATDSPKTQSRVKREVRGKKFTFRVLLDPAEELLRQLQGREVPYVVVIDAEGSFRYRHSKYRPGDEKKLEEIVVALLGEPEAGELGAADEPAESGEPSASPGGAPEEHSE
jgi:cytochrome c biogenesis protein CcmG/thiol:disulfide interchange protein DsbE